MRSSTTRAVACGALAVLASVVALACDRGAAPSAAPSEVPALDSLAARASVEAPPELAPSLVDLPVRYELGPALAALERAVPRTVGNLDERRPVEGHDRTTYAFDAERTPFEASVRGSNVTLSSIVTYRAKGWVKPPIGPSISGSCGIDGDAPRIRVTLTSALHLTPDWRLRARTAVPVVAPVSDEPRDKCRVTLLKLDVTDRVVAAVRGRLEGKAALLDEKVAALDVRSKVGHWWTLLGRPIRVSDRVWLELRPESLRVGALRGGLTRDSGRRSGGVLVAPVTLLARPRVVTGERPDSSTRALPDFTPGTPSTAGLHLLLEAVLGYDDATRVLTRQLVGRRFARGDRSVSVREVRAFAASGGRVALAIRLAGDVDARVVLVGKPRYDHATGTLRVPDLDYAVADASLLVRGADQVGHDALRDALRERAAWPVAFLVDSARARAERAMNRDLAKGVRLGAKLNAARALGVFAASDGLQVRASAGGRLTLDVDRAPRITIRERPVAPKPKRPGVPARPSR